MGFELRISGAGSDQPTDHSNTVDVNIFCWILFFIFILFQILRLEIGENLWQPKFVADDELSATVNGAIFGQKKLVKLNSF